ncbi:unnamed protein product [Durusdinium trenchii]|uniref:Uncharacterized protein n=1 Tax=Durusdinium trenchii TaxID=1381693 RepID=A0ABP0Q0H7_9DINO
MTLLPSLWVPKMPRLLVAIDSIAQVQVPRGATHFVAFAHGPGVLGSEPIASLRIQDLRPPTVMPLSIIVNDFSEESGVASFSFSFQPGRCQIDGDETCDAGSGFALYWVVKGQKMGKALWTSETDQVSLAAVAAARPPLATAVMVVARNAQGEMDVGPTAALPLQHNMDDEE